MSVDTAMSLDDLTALDNMTLAPCEIPHNCGKPAEFKEFRPCGCKPLCCSIHVEYVKITLASQSTNTSMLPCPRCSTPFNMTPAEYASRVQFVVV